jgi:lipopolysaccharide/colanic/teichoic acid biosynthesis glycosyltransferase
MWIKLSSRGPAFHCQMREGIDGQRIAVWKLRTMHVDGERLLESWFRQHPEDRLEWARYFKLRHDPRVLPWIGKLLRRTSLDELPQLLSVLRGEMSLVGPRPIVDAEVTKYQAAYCEYVKTTPGITGLWQVSGRNRTTYAERVAYDTYYVRNWSVWMDIYLLAKTVGTVLTGDGAY